MKKIETKQTVEKTTDSIIKLIQGAIDRYNKKIHGKLVDVSYSKDLIAKLSKIK
jgi:hypothetical protein